MCVDHPIIFKWRERSLPDDEIAKRYKDGESASSISKSYNTYHSTIIRHLKNQGIEIRPKYAWRINKPYSKSETNKRRRESNSGLHFC